MMTLHKLSVGDGYTYLTRHVAGGDTTRTAQQTAADYYTARGNPPGRWGGRGLTALELSGTVTETQMKHLFGQGMHPDADRIIAAYVREHVRDGMSDEELAEVSEDAIRAATLGRRFPVYATLEHFDNRVAARLDVIRDETGREPTQAEIGTVRAEEARRARGGVAGYDLVFTPVKSLVLLWALDDREWVRDAIVAIHEQARDSALALLEQHAAFTRTGDVGQAQLATKGLVYAVFDHYDSRDGDPNLHSHVPISNKIQGSDGGWRSLDGRALHRIAVAASEHYNSQIETLATAKLGVEFAVRPDTARKRQPVREVVGVPVEFITTFSSRRAQIEARYEQLVVEFRRAHGRDPDSQTAFRLAERANLDTRRGKASPRSLAELRTEWQQRLIAEHSRRALRKISGVVAVNSPEQPVTVPSTALSTTDLTTLAQLTVGRAEQSRSTWTVWNLRAEADRLLREPPESLFPDGLRFAGVEERTRVLEAVVARAVGDECVPVTVQPSLDEPDALRRPDGVPVFVEHGAARHTSRAILDAEQRLLTATRTTTGPAGSAVQVQAILDGYEATEGKTLDAGQRAMVAAFACDPRQIVVGLGPAGTGKTTTMHAYQHVLAAQHRRLIPLATSAAAAAVLGQDLGVPADNVHKFVLHHLVEGQPAPQRDGTLPPKKAFFHIRPGDVILVDEAGLAGTRNLDTLHTIAEKHGATIRLLGDYRQLSAVESGGALRLLATEAGAVELHTLHRFTNAAEADTTRQLRNGDTAALDYYAAHDRIRAGSAEAMIEQAYTAWHTDMTSGLRTLMTASTTAGVTALSGRARADRVGEGQVEADGVSLHDGNRAGRGDWIVTRVNDRQMTCNRGKDWVRNGDAWTVTARRSDGSLKVQHLRHGGTLTLPADYVAGNVELLYATTVHRAQGATVDTAHALISDDMTRETLYVAATRARQTTTLYAVTHSVLPVDEDARLDRTVYDRHARAGREVLETVLAREGAQPSATEAIARAHDDARSLATLVPRRRFAIEKADQIRLRGLVTDVLGDDATAISRDPAWPAVMRALHRAEADGWDLPQVLAGTARRGPLTRGDSPAQLLAWRIDDHIDGRTPTPALAAPTAVDTARYAALISLHAPRVGDLNPAEAIRTPSALHTDPVTGHTDHEQLLHLILDPPIAARTLTEPAWPALRTALRRAEHAGYQPADILTATALAQPLDTARSVSHVLAWRITRHLHEHPTPTVGSGNDGWRTLAWTLKAAEHAGQTAAQLLAGTRPDSELDGVRRLIHQRTRPAPAHGPLPWTNPAPYEITVEWKTYLDATDRLVHDRVQTLTAAAITGRPAWLAGLGTPPTDPRAAQQWRHHVETVAAFRDEYQITTDDPHQPLGTYQPASSAAHRAYLHAADAVLAARYPHQLPADPVTARVAADVYLALPDSERDTIARTVADRLVGDWLGPRHGDADTLITAPAYAAHLHTALVQRGHIGAAPDPAPQTAPPSPAAAPHVVRQTCSAPPMEQQQPQAGIQITY